MKITIYVHPEDLSDLRDALNFESSEENEIWVGNFIRISLFPYEGFVQTQIDYNEYVKCTDLGIFDESIRV
jgi:hypothetical protein